MTASDSRTLYYTNTGVLRPTTPEHKALTDQGGCSTDFLVPGHFNEGFLVEYPTSAQGIMDLGHPEGLLP